MKKDDPDKTVRGLEALKIDALSAYDV